MGEFVKAGHADRLDQSRAGIHIGAYPDTVTYEILISAIDEVLNFGGCQDIYQRVEQPGFKDDGVCTALQQAGTLSLSKAKRAVTVRPKDGRLYVINTEALRDAMHGKIKWAAVSEVVFKKSDRTQASLTA